MSMEDASSNDRPHQIGAYRILDVIGEGGMGTVYLAEQKTPVRRRVALKVIKLGMDSRAVVARFDAERQALSLMEQSNIARVFDCGLSESGQPYFAMEYVKGIPITAYCDQNKLSVKERIGLFQQVCSGVQHAHLKGVMHRDLKPDNVLVTLQDGKPLAKIIDFGLAKAMDHRLVEATIFTEHGTVVGTPEYMSPEQAGLGGLDVDTRTDVYSLGVLLYELLTGDLPFTRKELHQAGYLEMQRVIREQEPSKPSTKVTTLGDRAISQAQLRALDVRSFARTLRGDLDWITLKALEKDRTRRYDTAQELAADLGRYLTLEPVLASPPSAGYRARKFLRKYRGRVAAAGVVVFASLLFGGWALWERAEAEEQRSLAALQRQVAQDKVDQFNQISAIVRLEDLIEVQAGMWLSDADSEGWVAKVPELEEWLAACAELLEQRPAIEEAVTQLRGLVLPAETERAGDRVSTSTLGDDPGVAAARFLHEALVGALAGMESLSRQERSDVELRLRWAREIDDLSRAHPRARHTWTAVRDAIRKADDVAASSLYAGMSIEVPIVGWPGLVPIGMNPVTRMWEFYDLRSAWDGESDPFQIAIPEHDERGGIEVTAETGIVFVLLPGGEFWMGAQAEDPDGRNYDPDAREDEQLHPVALSPFLLARHELTQGQWSRLWTWSESDREPSRYKPGEEIGGQLITGANPVEQVSWDMCDLLLTRHGMQLPTEAQWEYGCRAGTTTPWQVPREELLAVGNLASEEFSKAGGTIAEPWADGHQVHAPVDSFRPNLFGLFDMHGNVIEWCRDGYGEYGSERPGDGLRATDASSDRCARGGGFVLSAAQARTGYRGRSPAAFRAAPLGLRPARLIAR